MAVIREVVVVTTCATCKVPRPQSSFDTEHSAWKTIYGSDVLGNKRYERRLVPAPTVAKYLG